jgi:hypothetical protein
MDRKLIIAGIALIAIVCAGVFAFSNTNSSGDTSISIDASALEDSSNLVVDGKKLEKTNAFFHSSSPDINAILVKNGGNLYSANSDVNKTGDTQTSGDDADFYGVNSAVLVNTNGTLKMSNAEINTNSKGSNGIFVTNANASGSGSSQGGGEPPQATGNISEDGGQPPEAPGNGGGQPPEATGNGSGNDGQPPEKPAGDGGQAPGGNGGGPGQETVAGTTQAEITNTKITTHADKSRGLDATYNGKIKASNIEIYTDGQSCAALATDRGEGEVHVTNGDINTGVSKTSGRGSPLIYSTGNITATNTHGTAYVSQIACIEGKNSIELSNCELTGYGEGNRKDGDAYVDLGGIFIYQSMSGDADVGTSHFKATNTKLTIPKESSVYKEAPMFHVTNTACVIDLVNSQFSFGSGTFIEVSSQNQWGNSGSNGGVAELNTQNEKIEGNVIVDSISSLNWTMKSTELKGAINSTGNTTVNVDGKSTWTLTGDSNVSNLTVSGKIDYGNFKLTVAGKTYDSSNPYKG